jgi:hypothetical protein
VFATYGALWYAPHHAELSRMAAYYGSHQYRPHSLHSLWLNVRRGLVGDRGGALRGALPYLLAMVPVQVVLALVSVRRGERLGPVQAALWTWLAGGLAFCLVSSYAPSRYYVLFLPALAGIAACGLMRMPQRIHLVVVGLFLIVSGAWIGRAFIERTNNLVLAQTALVQATEAKLDPPRVGDFPSLRPGSVIVGDFAPAFCLGTSFQAAPVQPGLSNDDRPVERLHAGYIAVTRAPVWENWWRGHYPGIIRPENIEMSVEVGANREYVVDIYRVR